ncbi:MAG TPA: glycosyltransferase 87 family protein [Acidobacteriaceae bacterium]|jgi:Gpi18-like mannosyltransferase
MSSTAHNPSRPSAPDNTTPFSVNAGLIILALALLTLRITLWRYFVNSDLLNAFLPWQTYLLEHGRWHALQHPFSMYFPAYFDITAMTSYLDGHINRVSQIKLVSFAFDIVTAAVAYYLVGRLTRGSTPGGQKSVAQLVAPFCILAGPTVLLNGAVWGQSDIVYTCFLLLSTFSVITGSGALAALFFGVAFAFKLQAIFLIPFIAAMVLQRRIRWWHLLLVPVGWLAALVPPVLNGAKAWQFLALTSSQGETFPTLAINVGNPWIIADRIHFNVNAGTLAGIVLTALVMIAITIWGRQPAFRNATNTLALATLSVLAIPYVMPKMHDRYFFPAEIFLCILSCIDLAFVLPAALVLSASLICYGNYFLYHVRYSVLSAALLANTAALWLVFQHLRSRVRAAEDTPQVPSRSTPPAAAASRSQTQIS